MLGRYTEIENLTFKDTKSYFNILFQDNPRKWICRLFIGSERSVISFPTDKRREGGAVVEERIQFESLKDLYSFENKLIEILKKYLPEKE